MNASKAWHGSSKLSQFFIKWINAFSFGQQFTDKNYQKAICLFKIKCKLDHWKFKNFQQSQLWFCKYYMFICFQAFFTCLNFCNVFQFDCKTAKKIAYIISNWTNFDFFFVNETAKHAKQKKNCFLDWTVRRNGSCQIHPKWICFYLAKFLIVVVMSISDECAARNPSLSPMECATSVNLKKGERPAFSKSGWKWSWNYRLCLILFLAHSGQQLWVWEAY